MSNTKIVKCKFYVSTKYQGCAIEETVEFNIVKGLPRDEENQIQEVFEDWVNEVTETYWDLISTKEVKEY
jgi:hypothetical protein